MFKLRTLYKVLCTNCTFVEFVDSNNSHSLSIESISTDAVVTRMYTKSDGTLVIHLKGTFDELFEC